MAIKKNDYIEITYTGRLKEDNKIFDTTEEDIAKENDMYNPEAKYKPIRICVGKGHVVKGLDASLEGKEAGKFKVEIKDIDAFGKKDAKLLKLLPMKLFTKENIKPFPGLDVNVDGQYGIVKSVSAGRVIVDFNHPLASKDVVYDVEIKRIITEDKEKIEATLEMLGMPFDDVLVEGKKAKVKAKTQLPNQISDALKKDLKESTGVDIEFEESKPENKLAEEKQANTVAKECRQQTSIHPCIDTPCSKNQFWN